MIYFFRMILQMCKNWQCKTVLHMSSQDSILVRIVYNQWTILWSLNFLRFSPTFSEKNLSQNRPSFLNLLRRKKYFLIITLTPVPAGAWFDVVVTGSHFIHSLQWKPPSNRSSSPSVKVALSRSWVATLANSRTDLMLSCHTRKSCTDLMLSCQPQQKSHQL
jgi:hypothetical protein